MTFEAPQHFGNEEGMYVPPVVHEVDPKTLQGAELEAAFKAGAVEDEQLTSEQRLQLHNKGFQVTLPEGEVNLPGADETVH
jgi:hypothetical protein